MRNYVAGLLLIPALALGGCEERKSGVIYHTPGEYRTKEPVKLPRISFSSKRDTDFGTFESYIDEDLGYSVWDPKKENFSTKCIIFKFKKNFNAKDIKLYYRGCGSEVRHVWLECDSQTFSEAPHRIMGIFPMNREDNNIYAVDDGLDGGTVCGATQKYTVNGCVKSIGIKVVVGETWRDKFNMEFSIEGDFSAD